MILELSHEALLYLLFRLKLPTLPGMPGRPFDELNAEHVDIVLKAGERALRARRLVQIEGDQVILDRTLVGLLALCVDLPNGVAVRRFEDSVWTSTTLLYNDEMFVEHRIQDGLHSFSDCEEPERLLARLQELVGWNERSGEAKAEKPAFLGCSLPLPMFVSVQALVKAGHDSDQVIRTLESEKIEPSVAQHLAEMLHAATAYLSVSGWRTGADGEVYPTSIGVFEGVDSWLIVKTDTHDSLETSVVSITELRVDEMHDLLKSLLLPPV